MSEESREWGRTRNWWVRAGAWAFGAVLLFHLVAYFAISCWQGDDRGTFGDMFGATNSVLSGLAFIGLIITLIMQRKELSLQREDLKLQYEEMKQSRVQLEKTAKAQQEMLRIAEKQDHARYVREYRAATLALTWTGKWSRDGKSYKAFGTNVGQAVSYVRAQPFGSDYPLSVEVTNEPLLPPNMSLELYLQKIPDRERNLKPDEPMAKFLIHYVDANGVGRTQEYELTQEDKIHCTQLGIDFPDPE